MGIVPRDFGPKDVRHIATSVPKWYDPIPVCQLGSSRLSRQRSGLWWASTSKKAHDLPVCRRCIKLIEATKEALDNDEGWTR